MNNIQKYSGPSIPPKKNKHRQSESGNVLFYILIAVVLFAALNFTVGNMMRGGNADMIGEEQAKLYAGEILDYARILKQGVQEMRINSGCNDSDIRFVASQTTGYGASVNNNCDIFHPSGGDVNYVPPNNDYGTGTEWLFVGANTVAGVGTASPDLVAILQNVNPQICTAINDKLGVAAITDDTDGVAYSKFTGTYASSEQIDVTGNQSAACMNDTTTGGGNFFFQTILVR